MAALYLNHNPASPCGSINHGDVYEARNDAVQPRLGGNSATGLDRLAGGMRFDAPNTASPISAMFGQLGRLSLVATQRSGHRSAAPTFAQRRLSEFSRSRVAGLALCLSLGLLGAGCTPGMPTRAENAANLPNPMFNAAYSKDADVPFVAEPRKASATGSKRGSIELESASRRTRDMADWVVSTRDNLNMPFAIIDKVNAKVYVFAADGKFQGAAPVLLGLAKGDYTFPGVGKKPMSQILPSQRTTPAGRFVTVMGRDHKGKETLWLDYEDALSMHAVVKGTRRDRRAQRLASPTPHDNRISFGCINVPKPFFSDVIESKFSKTPGVVYILPETKQFKKSQSEKDSRSKS